MRSVGRGGQLTGRGATLLVGAIALLLVGNAIALAAHGGAGSRGGAGSLEDQLAAELEQLAPGDGVPKSPAEPTSSTTAGTAASGGTAPKPKPSDNGKKGGASTPTSVFEFTYETTPPPQFNPYTYDVAIQPTCAVVGQLLTVTFRIEPGYAAGLFVIYGDGQHHDKYWGGNADATGVATHSWTAPRVPGEGRVHTVAYGSNNRMGKTQLDFRIVPTPTECGA